MSRIVLRKITLQATKAVFTVIAVLFSFLLYAQQVPGISHKWVIQKPFVHNVFIENKGQFPEDLQKSVGDKILYYTHKGYLNLYFTSNTLTFKYDRPYSEDGKNEALSADEDENIKVKPEFMSVHWDGANSNPQVEVQNPEDDYFTYPNPKEKIFHSSILAHAWKKIIYHNLYNNIDVAFYYPNDKNGLEYDIIVHPGGDPSQVKMHYSDNAQLSLINSAINILSSCANFTDRAPIARDENGSSVSAAFTLHNNTVSFTTGNYDKSKLLIIDPLLSTTSFTSTNKAYDMQYDLVGNVYVMGGGDATENQLQKYNSAGALQWTYTCTFAYTSGGLYYYGGFATDNRSGTSYIAEGLDYSGGGSLVVKVNSLGALVTTFPGNANVEEMWRIAFDYCDNQLIIGAGAKGYDIQACTLDTSLTTINSVNALGAGNTHHDIAMVTFDGVGKCYMATTKPASAAYPGFDNILFQMPAATLAPTAYQVFDRSHFIETASQVYYPSLIGGPYIYSGNGFNGLVADLNMVVTYDGNKMRKWTPATGAIVDSVTVTPTGYTWGGLALDCEDNLYVGNVKKVSIYNSSLAPIGVPIALPDTVYDVKLSPTNILYTCGNGYVSKDSVSLPKMITVVSPSTTCGCTGTATATVCDNYPYTYSWSNGQTTQTATGLCPGKYIITIKDAACIPRIDTASVVVSPGSGSLTGNATFTNVKCFGDSNGTATANATSGTAPYTYQWNTGSTNQTDTGLIAGNYTCVVKDAGGCSDTLKVSITQPAPLEIKATTFPATCSYLCNGQAIIVPSGGTNPYTYTWSNGGSAASISNLCVGTTYSITVTDLHGCTHDTTITVSNPPPIKVTTDSTAALCSKADGSAGIATITGGTPGYTYSWSNGATSSSITAVVSDVYCVIISDANKCADTVCINVPFIAGDSGKIVNVTNELCYGGSTGSATVAGFGGVKPYTYSWAPSGGTGATATNLSAGIYTVTVTDSNGCITWVYPHITQPTKVIVTAPDQTICISQSATLTATGSGGTPGYTYLWNATTTGSTYTSSPTSTTTYNLQATDANGCIGDTTVTVHVRNPLIVVCGPPTNMCAGSQVTLTATGAGGDSTYTYTWAPGGHLGDTLTVSPTVTTTYTVTITDACGTPSAQSTVTVVINPAPVVNFKADTLQGCAPLCVNFTDMSTVSAGTIVAWYWNFGDGDTSGSQNPQHCYTKPGLYTVSLTVTSSNGCKGSFTINNYIDVFSYPIANFSLSPQPTNILNPTIYFTDESTDKYGIVNWFWQFGDGTDSVGLVRNPLHSYQDTGAYCVTLTVTNVHGCTADTTKCLEIEPFFVIYVPNAFTPNGNGRNDYFTAKGVGIVTYEMWIFDRWGMQIYHTNSMSPGWNGVVQSGGSGEMAQEDTYVWLIEVTDVFHKDHKYIGRVTLIK